MPAPSSPTSITSGSPAPARAPRAAPTATARVLVRDPARGFPDTTTMRVIGLLDLFSAGSRRVLVVQLGVPAGVVDQRCHAQVGQVLAALRGGQHDRVVAGLHALVDPA